jgi:hypothetical protein
LNYEKKNTCIPLGIKDDNTPPKFVIPIENTTLKDHNSYKNGLKILNFNNMEHMETKDIHNYAIDLKK